MGSGFETRQSKDAQFAAMLLLFAAMLLLLILHFPSIFMQHSIAFTL